MDAPKNLSSFSPDEVKKLIRSAKIRKRFDGIDIIGGPKLQLWGRILVITSRKVGNAPERNKIRRRLKAIFYEEKLFERGYDCIVFVKQGGVDCGFEELKAVLLSVFDER